MTDQHTTQVPPSGTRPVAGVRRVTFTVFRVVAVLTLAAIVVQFAFAGLGTFGASFGPHRTLGGIIGMLAVLLLVLALIARPGWDAVLRAVVLVALATVLQSVLADLGGDTDAWFGALHVLNGLAIMGLTASLSFGTKGFTSRVDRA